MKRLPLGTELFTVIENFSDHSLSGEPYHLEIVSGKITQYIQGNYLQYVVPTKNRLGRKSVLEYIKSSNVGKTAFLTYEEAVAYADMETDGVEQLSFNRGRKILARPWRNENEQK